MEEFLQEQCRRCGAIFERGPLRGVYCSDRCCKLYLKAKYRKRNHDKINAYNRQYRQKQRELRAGFQPTNRTIEALKKRDKVCRRCASKEQLRASFIKPHWAGGTNKLTNLLLLCQPCHYEFDVALRAFWTVDNHSSEE